MNISRQKSNEELGRALNLIIISIGICIISIGVVSQFVWYCSSIIYTLLYSVGTSVLASGIVLIIQAGYLVAARKLDDWLSTWRVLDLYVTKSEMNVSAANSALENCSHSVDIIAEGMSAYRAMQETLLRRKISQGVKFRILSCDSEEMLQARARDESPRGGDEFSAAAVNSVKELTHWVEKMKKEEKGNIELRFHSSYPGFSYLRIDSMIFISPNLWRKKSQYSFAVGFLDDGKGGQYFSEYFEKLWSDPSFTHVDCMISQ